MDMMMNNGMMMLNNMNNMNNMNAIMMMNNLNNMNMNNMNNLNNMNNMMMNNMMMNNAMNPMNNIMANNMMNNMNNVMPMSGQMMPQSGNMWNLIFQRKISQTNIQQSINIAIDPDKLFIEAISMFKLRIGSNSNEDFKFIFNGKDVIKDLKISQTGLMNNSVITVISLSDVTGA